MIVGVTFSPEAAPGCCKVCGGVEKEWYLDLGYSEEFYGAVYFCNECISYAAEVCGFLGPVARANLENKVEALETELFDYKTRYEALELSLDGLLRARFVVSADPSSGDAPDLLEGVGQDSGDAPPSGDGVGEGEGTAPEPLHDEGVGELRPDDGSDGDLEFHFG